MKKTEFILLHPDTAKKMGKTGKRSEFTGIPVITRDDIPENKAYLINKQKFLNKIPVCLSTKEKGVKYFNKKIKEADDVFVKLELIREKYMRCSVGQLLGEKKMSWFNLFSHECLYEAPAYNISRVI
jgi:hypothetical protein